MSIEDCSEYTVNDFLKLSGAPADLHTLAEYAQTTVGDWRLAQAAESYLKYHALFLEELEKIGFEIG